MVGLVALLLLCSLSLLGADKQQYDVQQSNYVCFIFHVIFFYFTVLTSSQAVERR